MSTFTTNKNLELPANNADVNTWDVPVNADFTAIDTALGGVTNINAVAASGTVTLSSAQYTPPNISITGALTSNVNYQFPSGVGGVWSVSNATSGAYTITFSSAGAGATVVLAQGYRTQILCDGTSVALTQNAPTSAAGSSGQVQVNSSGALSGSTGLAYSGTNGLFTSSSSSCYFTASGPAGNNRGVVAETSGTARWYVIANGDSESGANAGSNFSIIPCTDAGALASAAMTINRATGIVSTPIGLTIAGTTSTQALTLPNIFETGNISGSAIGAGTVNLYVGTASILYFTGSTSSNWTTNITLSAGTTLNSVMSTGQVVTCVLMATQGSTAYYCPFFQIDGASVTPNWQGGVAPTSGNANGIDAYTFTVIKTGSAAFTVLASLAQFK